MTEEELLVTVYDAFNRREIDTVLASLHPEVDWPNGMEGGRELGRDAVRAYWTRQWGMVDPNVKPVAMEREDDDRIAIRVHQVVRDLTGQVILDQMIQHVYTFRDGLISRMEIRPAEQGRFGSENSAA